MTITVNNSQPSLDSLNAESRAVRRAVLRSLYLTGGGHFGGSLSVVDVLVTLYRRLLRHPTLGQTNSLRDRLIFSKGHACIALYEVMRRVGLLDVPDLLGYGSAESPLEGHPDMTSTKALDFSSGSLGQGLAVGCGMAMALQKHSSERVWVILGDGELQEGCIWEAAALAARYRLASLSAIIDANGFQEYGWTQKGFDSEPVTNLTQKWAAFGWHVNEVDGHDHEAIARALQDHSHSIGRPSITVARTRKGAGCSLIEQHPSRFHCGQLTEEEFQNALMELDNGTTM
jgi:transketolase